MPDCPLCGPECNCPAYLVAMGANDEELEIEGSMSESMTAEERQKWRDWETAKTSLVREGQCAVYFGGYQESPIRCALPAGHPVAGDSEFHAGFDAAGKLIAFPVALEAE